MKKILCALLSTMAINFAVADTAAPILNEVTFQLTTQKWVQTDNAKIIVSIHATLNKHTLAQMREQILNHLNKIAGAQWHVTHFDRSQDSSGLETLYVEAQARVNESKLTSVNAHAKALSEPGVQYDIKNIDFSPSSMDIEAARQALRAEMYQKVSAEIATLNKLYPTQKYVLHNVRFFDYEASVPRGMVMMATGGRNAQEPEAPAVSNLVTLRADVDVASQ